MTRDNRNSDDPARSRVVFLAYILSCVNPEPLPSPRFFNQPFTIAAIVLVLAFAIPASAQDGSRVSQHPFALGTWGGDSAAPNTEVYDFRIPMGFTVFTSDTGDWSLRVRFVLYGGVYDFTIEEAIDLDLTFSSLAATPGIEILIPVGKGWILKPFAEIGYGHDFDNALGFGVWSVGIRTIVTWPVKKWHLSFGTKFQYLSTFTSDIAFADDYGEIRLGFDARHPLPFTMQGKQADLSGYYIRRHWVDAFIAEEGIEPLEVRYTNEFGFTFGATPKVKLWIIPLPRIGLGYRFGPNITGWRINFGFPF